ncbi:PadR family transcriptional regulator [Deinococcus multiflagellatus]|uniref:PadR family transcriptional regulator n=1 Tax=Deinococcus multiflagellatus TaxID=1656887 RepID=A0ABW1ZRR3_9DEIO|nr:helix-turn-helix transcriptional regulator [Deinococcus multiflagellatus]MBZ9714416.1 PadR family transcriptional regulator [Deinococcus multiflagellatus]
MTTNDLKLAKHLYEEMDGETYALALTQSVGLNTTALYNSLARLERIGWIVGRWEEGTPAQLGRPARKYYRLTEKGMENYRETIHSLVPSALLRGLT